jgi:RNA polymerase sigma-70 factor (ECF subfamily)
MWMAESPVHRAPLEAVPDADWVARARRGDAGAFRRIFDAHAGAVRRFLADQLGAGAAADEATQETFVRAWGHLGQLRESGALKGWLLGVARNVARETRRRPGAAEGSDKLLEARVDPAHGPEATALEREADRLLQDALGRLDEERRVALVLRSDHGLSYDEIAREMGWPLAKVKNEIHRARLELRAALGWYVGGDA